MNEMHAWNARNIGNFFDTPEGRRMLINATFIQAKENGVTILEIGLKLLEKIIYENT